VSGVEATLLSLHQMGAAFFSIPDLALDKNEAKAMAEAIAEVSKYYSIPGLNPAHAAVVSLFLVMITTYGKRIPAILRGARGAPPLTPAPGNGADHEPPDYVRGESAVVSEPWFAPS
jgi:hypothetical protein